MNIAEELSRGYQLQQQGKLAEAIACYRTVIATSPEQPEPWCYLGMGLHDQQKFQESEDAYRKSLKLQPNFPIAWNNLGNTLRMQGNLEEAVSAFEKAIELKPGYFNAIRNKATAFFWAGKFKAAEQGFLQCVHVDRENAESRKSLGILRLLTGRYREGWQDYDFRLKTASLLPKLPGPAWKGEEIKGKTLMLVAEQGLGDTIQFARYGSQLKEKYGCRVVAWIQDALVPLLSNSTEKMGLDEVAGRKMNPPAYDVWAPLLSLPGILDQEASDFPAPVPYLEPWEDKNPASELLMKYDGVKVGIAWQGSRQNEGDVFRSFPLSALMGIANLQGVNLFSLQKGAGIDQLAMLGEAMGVVDLGRILDQSGGAFMGTVALMKQLDLVVTADTAIAHVAGALGVPVWVALSHVPDWRWGLDSTSTPWYPTMRLFRQKKMGEWDPVFEEMASELKQLHPKVESIPLPQVGTIEIPFTPGEVLDRITILEVKRERISNPDKLQNVAAELGSLQKVWLDLFGKSPIPTLDVLKLHLKRVNESLWDAEDAVRDFEDKQDFTEEFVTRARSIYQLNDHRALLKRQVNEKLGATWQEEKSYQ